jgi:phosphatidate cytidylyltransferase
MTAAVGIPLFFLLVQYLSPAWFCAFMVICAAVGQWEFYRMFKNSGYNPQTAVGLFLGTLVIIGFYIGSTSSGRIVYVFSPDVLIAFAFAAALVFRLFSRRDTNGAMADVALTFTGVVYVAWLVAYVVLLRSWNLAGIDGRDLIFFLMFVTWATDTGAYYIGSYFGRHKLYPKISPKKSIEGAIGGLVFAVGMAVACTYWFYHELPILDAIALGLILGIIGQVGDLAESMIKRSARVKDSGGVIPGHGGVLDRMDSILLNAPALYYYTVIMVTATGNGTIA